jgi:hypothetical protein
LIPFSKEGVRYLLAGKGKDGTAVSFNDASLHLFKKIPNNYCKTLTIG